ncbi:diguanylate cyclase [Lysinibacillus yapensis]|uniref:Diguanylate cyclase n=1 Tax=Ureibacillus yapensis TaxID=2304605 RepID=A0A396S9H7_9BACL|nr:diguanylate cyclase [Lysinibacillus yapensis]RHW32048.1 diguanylate cyclase [Lysinibacillus yapensis]
MVTHFALGFLMALIMVLMPAPFLYKKWQKKIKELKNFSRFGDLAETTKDSSYYYQVYPTKKFLYLSSSTDNVLGKGSAQEAYLNPEICFRDIHPDDYEIFHKKVNGELDYTKSIIQRWKDRSGEYRWFEEYATPIYENGKLVAIKGVLRNIDERVQMQRELEYRYKHDALTDLYNRAYFEQKNAEYDEQLNIPVGIIICDLDELKYVNDNFGHKEGDRLIKDAAGVLNKFSSDTVIVARIGGDEFAIIHANSTANETEELVKKIHLQLDMHSHSSLGRKINLSIGFASSDRSKGNMNRIFAKADQMMYEHKIKRKQYDRNKELLGTIKQ